MERPIGILGGMGPGAGVYFKQLIVEKTNAACDQEHIPTLLYTNPQIPDRTDAILDDDISRFVDPVCDSLIKLEQFGVSEIFIPCNTAFVGFDVYTNVVSSKIYHLPAETLKFIKSFGSTKTLLLATMGTYSANTYRSGESCVEIVYPTESQKETVGRLIAAVKSGDMSAAETTFLEVVSFLQDNPLPVILGCTELSLFGSKFFNALPKATFYDPLHIAADYIIDKYSDKNQKSRSAH